MNANEGCNSCASLAGLVSSFIACFILRAIAPLVKKYRRWLIMREIMVEDLRGWPGGYERRLLGARPRAGQAAC